MQLRAYLGLALLGLSACGSGGEEPGNGTQAAAMREVSVARVELRPLVGGITASGVLVAREEAAVGAEVGGYRVTQVLADEGDFVRAGQPLVRMDPTLLRAQIAQLEANLAQQRFQASQAQREAARVAGLDREGVLATEQIEQRRTAAATAGAQVRAAEAQLAELRTRVSRLTITAPVSGRVLERNVRPGEIGAAGGTPMFRIARGGEVELQADVPEAELASIRAGQPVQVQLPSGQNVTGTVRTLSAEVSGESRLGGVRISLPSSANLRVGGFGRAQFTGAISQSAAVPEGAVRFDANGTSVMTLTEGNRARRVAVRTGRRASGWVELVSGPPPGTVVLLGGGAFVLEGEQVKPVRARAAPATSQDSGGSGNAEAGPATGAQQAADEAQGSAPVGAGGQPGGASASQGGGR